MVKNAIIGFLCGMLFSIGIYSSYFFFVYAPKLYKANLHKYNTIVLPVAETFLECRKCESNSTRSLYECATGILKKNNGGIAILGFGYKPTYEQFIKNKEDEYRRRVDHLKTECALKDTEEYKERLDNIKHFCKSGEYVLEICSMEETCKKPETAVWDIMQSEVPAQICQNQSSVISTYQMYLGNLKSNNQLTEYLERGEVFPAPRLIDELERILYPRDTLGVFVKPLEFLAYFPILNIIPLFAYYFIIFIIFILPSVIGVIIGIYIARKTAFAINKR